ncbi:MAG TPA: carboxypeptidase-like regulatory domain-containing protein [Candidatus Angelobacter sp.]|nr:carboxypeptidase-like regulatory domain-containing protein [Candidatus Angelobacter sp.]
MKRFVGLLGLAVCVLGMAAQQPAASSGAASFSTPVPLRFEISGRVIDAASGARLAHTVVALAPTTKRDELRTVITDDDGQFRFADLPPGKYTLTAQCRGYLTESYEQHDQYSTSIVTGPGLESTNLVFRLRPDGAIYGRVTDDHNEPVASAQLVLFRIRAVNGKPTADFQRRAPTTDEGLYRFSHVPPGKYYLVVSASPWYAQRPQSNLSQSIRNEGTTYIVGQQPAQQTVSETPETRSPLDVAFPTIFYPGALDLVAATPIILPAGGRFVADFALQPVPAVRVRVNLGEPSQDRQFNANLTQVVADNLTLNLSPMTFTMIDKNTVEMSGVAPGHYTLEMNMHRGNASGQTTRTLEISGNTAVRAEEVSSFSQVSGAVSFDDGSSFPAGGFVQLRDQKSRQVLNGQMSAQGEFEIKQAVPAGSYDVSVNMPNSFLKGMAASGAKISGQTINITASGPVKLAVMLTNGVGRVDGKALRDDKPLAGVMIVLVPKNPATDVTLFRLDQSDSDGSFTLSSVMPGRYTVLAIEKGWELEWANPEILKAYLPQGEPLEVQANGKYQVKLKVQ